MAKIVIAGHASCDLPLRPVDREVFETDTVFVDKIEVCTGGDALNVTVGLNKLGLGDKAKYVTVVGDDLFGRITVDILKELGIDTSGVIVKCEADSIATCILIDKNNERHFVFSGNSSRKINVEDVIGNIEGDTEYLHIGSFMSLDSLEFENSGILFKKAKEMGLHTSFDVTFDDSGRWLEKIKPALPYTDIFFASYDEAVALSGGLKEPFAIADYFGNFGIKKAVIKLGPKGCYITDYEGIGELIPAFEGVKVVDTTGAGDAFVAAYLFGLLSGFSMRECAVLGNANGALAIGKVGANVGSASRSQIIEFLKGKDSLNPAIGGLLEKLAYLIA
ncbi:MAG: carbohydrate kinase family protein [Lachnospiraceae bacterium]|jgi:sugar/nucleoside kinase (ribokinase family)|nr:carbohydrate kinase family protein [Lachnospiraceae bacterium]